jgi:hypothetical protein
MTLYTLGNERAGKAKMWQDTRRPLTFRMLAVGSDYGDYSGLAFHGGYFFPSWCSYGNTTESCGEVHTCRIAW